MPTDPSSRWQEFEIEQSGSARGSCDCCGTATKRIWGFVRRTGDGIGAYFVTWTDGKPDHGAKFDLVLGKWGNGATKDDRYAVALDFRVIDRAPKFMVVDATGRVATGDSLFSAAMKRSDVIGSPLAPQVFAIVDAIYMSDAVIEVRHWSEN